MMNESERLQFEGLLQQHQKIVVKVAHIYCWNKDDRAELIQEIGYQLCKAFPRFNDQLKFSTWMYRIALNVAISYVRRMTVHQTHFANPQENEFQPQLNEIAVDDKHNTEAHDREEVLRQFMQSLDNSNRALLILYLEEYNYDEIAEIIGISSTNVSTKINRLKQQISNFVVTHI